MLQRLEAGGYVVEFDREATAAAYSRFAKPGPEACGCRDCRNWAAGREALAPPAVRELLAKLGVPLAGEIEVYEMAGDERPHLYGGWYMVVGGVVSRPPDEDREFVLGGWRLSWGRGRSYEVPQFTAQPVCELHFLVGAGNYLPADAHPSE